MYARCKTLMNAPSTRTIILLLQQSKIIAQDSSGKQIKQQGTEKK